VPDRWPEFAKFLKDDPRLAFDFLTMVTAVDYEKPTPSETVRLDVVYHLYSISQKHKMVVKISLPRENPSVQSVVQLWPGADWQEREVYDMYGIRFLGHPNCTRILMWDGFPGWPLRKDYVHVPDRYDD
jgi:NADH-quinone oxidoreductase subunit C